MASPSTMDFIALHPFVRSTVVDKVRGIIIGSALGDTVGLYTEFLSKQQAADSYGGECISLVDPTTPFRGDSHRDKFAQRAWTDDTDHALLILLSYLHQDGQLNATDFAARLHSWREQGLRCLDRLPLGLGRTVGAVVTHTLFLENPAKAAKQIWLKSQRNAAANGSLMRTHPLGIICIGLSRDETFQTAMDFSLVTHTDPRCVVACCIVTELLRRLLRGDIRTLEDTDVVIEEAFEWVSLHPRAAELWDLPPEHGPLLERAELEKHVYAKTLEDLHLDASHGMGYVYKALGAALLTLRHGMCAASTDTDVFGALMHELVMQGGDADTNACVAGALLGGWVGFSVLTPQWRDGLAHSEWLLAKIDGLCETIGIVEPEGIDGYRGSADPDTRLDGGRGLLEREALMARENKLVTNLMEKRKARDDDQRRNEEKRKSKGWAKLIGR